MNYKQIIIKYKSGCIVIHNFLYQYEIDRYNSSTKCEKCQKEVDERYFLRYGSCVWVCEDCENLYNEDMKTEFERLRKLDEEYGP